jgi:hypothetical protein
MMIAHGIRNRKAVTEARAQRLAHLCRQRST